MGVVLCRVAHPCLCVDALAEAHLQIVHQLLHHLLAGSWEVTLAVHLTEGLTHSALHFIGSTLPQRIFHLAARHGLTEEVETCLTNLIGEIRRRGIDQIPLHDGTQLIGVLQGQQTVVGSEESWLADVHLLDVVELHTHGLTHLGQRNVRIAGLKLLERHLIVVGLRVAQLGIALGSQCQLGLKAEHLGSFLLCLCVVKAIELEHRHEVLAISVADSHCCGVAVEIPVLLTQCQSTLSQ